MYSKKNTLIIYIFSVFFAVLLCGCTAEKESLNDSLITIGKEEVSYEEYSIYLDEVVKNFEALGGSDIWDTDFDGKSAFEAAKDNALSTLKMIKLTVSRSQSYDIFLSDNEINQAKKAAEDYVKRNDGKVSYETAEKFMLEKSLYTKTRESILSEYNISLSNIDDFIKENWDYYTDSLTEITYSAVLFDDEKTAEKAYETVVEGDDFEKIANEYGASLISDRVSEKIYEINNISVNTDDLKEGFVSQVQKMEDGFVIYKIYNVLYPSNDELREEARADYEQSEKNRVFNSMVSSWEKEVQISLNTKMFSAIKKEIDTN